MSLFGHMAILATGKALFGIDAFGWGVIFFLLLLFGVPYTRYFLRAADIPDWPIVSARVTKAAVITGVPPEFVPRIAFATGRVPQLIPYHCRASYSFLVDGALYEGWFAWLAKDQAGAESFAEAVKGQTVLVKYDPRKPADSVVEGKEVLGRKVIQDSNILNPKVW